MKIKPTQPIPLALRGGLYVAGLFCLLWASPASAELTVLPILRDGKVSEGLTQSVAERLQLLGEEPEAAQSALSAAEQGCVLPACLGGLAARLRAKRLVLGRVVTNAARRYLLDLQLFERSSGRQVKQSAACEDCSERQLQDQVAALAARLVDPTEAASGPVAGRAATGSTARSSESAAAASSAATERRLAELTEQLRGDRGLQQKLREQLEQLSRTSEAQGRAIETLRSSIDKTRGSTDKLRESSERTGEQASQGAQKVQASVDGLKQSVDRSGDATVRLQVGVAGLKQAIDRNSEVTAQGRAASDSSRAAAERLGQSFERVAQLVEAARQGATAANETSQAGQQLAQKTLSAVEQLNNLSGELRTALTQVEPLHAAAQQTQAVAEVNRQKSAELLQQAQSESNTAAEVLQHAQQTLSALKTDEARRRLPRGRKIGAAVLGGFSLLLTGAVVTLAALNDRIVPNCTNSGQAEVNCPLNFSAAYIPIAAVGASLSAVGTVALLAVPVSK